MKHLANPVIEAEAEETTTEEQEKLPPGARHVEEECQSFKKQKL